VTSEHHLGVYESLRVILSLGPGRVLVYGYTTSSGVNRGNWEAGFAHFLRAEDHYD
jgi:hypothetical protein